VSVRFDRDEASQLLVAALDALGRPFLLHDDDLILFANAAAAEFLGAEPGADIAGLSLDAFVVPELESVTRERRTYLLHTGVAFSGLPIQMRTLDGRTVSLKVDARPIEFEGTTIGVVTLAE
jgi:PAS domain-containing protein